MLQVLPSDLSSAAIALTDNCRLIPLQEALAEEARHRAKFENDTEIAKAKRDYELKKAAYDIEVQTKVCKA